MSKFGERKQKTDQATSILGGITGFGVAISFPIFALVFVYFPEYLISENYESQQPAFTFVISIAFYVLSIACLVIAVGGFAIELNASPKMRAYLRKELKSIFAKPLRSLRRQSTTREGLENGSIAVLFFGLAAVAHLVGFGILDAVGLIAVLIKVLLILPFLLIGSLAVAASIDSTIVKPVLLNREQRRTLKIEPISWSSFVTQVSKVLLFLISLASTCIAIAELISRL